MADYLAPFVDSLPAGVYEDNYIPPSTGGTEEGLRANIAKGIELLENAGWSIDESTGMLVNDAGEGLEFEILLNSPSWERIAQPFIDNLERMGVKASMNIVDPSQYETLMEGFDFDVTVQNRAMSPSPGNEQRNYWTCESAETTGSQNYWGLCNPAVDELVENVVQAESREDLESATQALDRALQWQFLCVPHWHIRSERVAYWNVMKRPEKSPAYGIDLNTWYFNEDAADEVIAAQEELVWEEPTEEPPPEEAADEAADEEAATEDEEEAATEDEAAQEDMATEGEQAEAEAEEGSGGMSTSMLALIAIVALVLIGAVLFFRRQPSE
jgi:microcin C transport system substrate-binding protein